MRNSALRIAALVTSVAALTACTDAPSGPVTPPETTVTTSTVPAPGNTVGAGPGAIHDGIWTVGRDVAPGTYRTAAEVTEKCYWWMYPSGPAEKAARMTSGVPGGGRPTVTLVAGDDFQVWNCGTWVSA